MGLCTIETLTKTTGHGCKWANTLQHKKTSLRERRWLRQIKTQSWDSRIWELRVDSVVREDGEQGRDEGMWGSAANSSGKGNAGQPIFTL